MKIYAVVNGKRQETPLTDGAGVVDLSQFTFTEYWIDEPCIVCVDGAQAKSGGGRLNTGGSMDPGPIMPPPPESPVYVETVEPEQWQAIGNESDGFSIYAYLLNSAMATLSNVTAIFGDFRATYRASVTPGELGVDEITAQRQPDGTVHIAVRTPGGPPGTATISLYGSPL